MDWEYIRTLLEANPDVVWAVVGVVLLVIEAFGISGIGLINLGLAAITLSLFIATDTLDRRALSYKSMGFLYLGLTFLWFISRWLPVQFSGDQKEKTNQNRDSMIDVVGSTGAVVSRTLRRDRDGAIKWEGQTMYARIAPEMTVGSIPKGQQVWVTGIDGNTLLVRPLGYKKHVEKRKAIEKKRQQKIKQLKKRFDT